MTDVSGVAADGMSNEGRYSASYRMLGTGDSWHIMP